MAAEWSFGLSVYSAPRRQEVKQPAEAADEGGHVGVGGGVEGLGHALHFVAVDDAEADELDLGALAGVELDGQGDELEDREHKVDGDTEVDREGAEAEEEAAEHNDGQELRGEPGDRHEGHAGLEGRVGLLVLDGVPSFVCRYAESGQTEAPVVVLAQGEALVGRVVVIRQRAVALDDFHVVDARTFHHGLGGLAAGDAPAGGHLHILAVGTLDFHLGPKADEDGNDDED